MNYTIYAREMQEKSIVFLEKSQLFSVLFRPFLFSFLAAASARLLFFFLDGRTFFAVRSVAALIFGGILYLVFSYLGGTFRVEKLKMLSKYTKKR